jgi:hypothetical protein
MAMHGDISLDGIKPQQQNQWPAGVKLPHTQSQQSGSNYSEIGGNVVGQNRYPLGLVLSQETRPAWCSKSHHCSGRQRFENPVKEVCATY